MTITNIQSYFIIFVLLTVFTACNTNSYLDKGEYYVAENEITVKKKSVADRVEVELPQYIKIKPNTGFLWFSKRWFYINNEKNPKDGWFRNFVMNNFSEKPAILRQQELMRSRTSMTNYLKKNGYFDANVSNSYDTLNKYDIKVYYNIYPGERTYIDSFYISSLDTNVLKIVRNDWRNKFFDDGSPVSEELYNSDVSRIVQLLKNNGYPYFAKNYISNLQLDTSDNKVLGRLVISRPKQGVNHQVFKNNDVFVHSKFDPTNPRHRAEQEKVDTVINGISFIGSRKDFGVKRSTIANKISIDQNNIFRQRNLNYTLRQIGDVAYFGYPVIKMDYDTTGNRNFVDYNLFMKNNTRMDIDHTSDVFYSAINGTDRLIQLIGLSAGVSVGNRNIFGGAEYLRTGVEGSVEFDPFSSNLRNSYFIGLNNSLEIPQFIRFPLFYDLVDKISNYKEKDDPGKFPERLYKGSQTVIGLNYSYTRRGNNYMTHQLSTSFGYKWNASDETSVELDHIGVDVWLPTILEDYEEILEDNQYLQRTFEPRILTGFVFRRASTDYKTPINRFGEIYTTNIDFETSGLEVLLAETVAGGFKGVQTPFLIDSTRFAKYLRAEVTATYSRDFTKYHGLALRFNTGIAFSLTQEDIPYFKQFYVGGPYSMRAWPVRGLGPGTYVDQEILEEGLPLYQTGDFKLEMNAEYRFNLFYYLNGAIFLDVGNVWNLKTTDYGTRTKLQWDSYKDIAIGSGVGLRLDIYGSFVLRFDVGYPIRTPYLEEGEKWQSVQDFSLSNTQLNFAFGYPF